MSAKCLYCGSEKTQKYYDTKMPLFLWPIQEQDIKENERVPVEATLCLDCHYAFNAQKIPPSLLERIYNHYLFSFPSKGIGHSAFRGIRDAILRHVPREKHVVEIGASDGYLLTVLDQEGYSHLLGIDPSPRVAPDFKIPFLKGYFTVDTDCAPVDVFILNHVLEHLENPWLILDAMYRKLPQGGMVIAVVPDTDWALIHQHLSFFTPEFLCLIGEKSGFTVKELELFEDTIRVVYKKEGSVEARDVSSFKEATLQKIEGVLRRKKQFKEEINAFFKECKGERVYWWGTGSSGVIGFESLEKENVEGVDLVIVDGDPTREGLLFSATHQTVHFVEKTLTDNHDCNVLLASVLYNELFESMQRIRCKPKRVFWKDRKFWS